MTLLLWTEEAKEDLLDIYVTIGVDSLDAAERFYSEIGTQISVLRDFPRMGTRRPDTIPTARMLIHGVYLVFYETRPDTNEGAVDEVKILRIVHGHRDLKYIL